MTTYAPYTPEDDLFPPTPYAPTPEAIRIAQEQLDNVEPIDLEEVATYQTRVDAAYERAYERANELVSPNSPEYESLLNSLTEEYLEEEGGQE